MMSEGKVDRYLRYATEDMYKNEEQEIRCACRKCKLMTVHHPYSGVVRDHLLMHGFMDDAPWMNDDVDDVGVNAAPMAVHDDEGHHDMMVVENKNEYPIPYNINAPNTLRLIFTLFGKRYNLASFACSTSLPPISSRTSSPRAFHLLFFWNSVTVFAFDLLRLRLRGC